MVTFIARIRMRPGKENAAHERARRMVAAVEATEPGAWIYIGHGSQSHPQDLVFFEAYADAAACEVHEKTAHFAELLQDFGDVFDAEFGVQIEYLDRIAGMVRPA